jgi:hypothetical protein
MAALWRMYPVGIGSDGFEIGCPVPFKVGKPSLNYLYKLPHVSACSSGMASAITKTICQLAAARRRFCGLL